MPAKRQTTLSALSRRLVPEALAKRGAFETCRDFVAARPSDATFFAIGIEGVVALFKIPKIPKMGKINDSLASGLFGATRQAVLRLLFAHPEERLFQSQILRTVGLGSGAVQRELERLSKSGIILRLKEGKQIYYKVNPDCPIFAELQGLIRKTFGVAEVLTQSLAVLEDGIQIAFIYGSVAKGRENSGSDVNLMVIGEDVSFGEIVAALVPAQELIRREINPSVYPTKEFRQKLGNKNHFISSVIKEPKIFLIGNENELAKLAGARVVNKPPAKQPRNK